MLHLIFALFILCVFTPEYSLGQDSECREFGVEYTGTKSTSISGSTCMVWNLFTDYQIYDYAHNYCRKVNGNDDDAYCIVEVSGNYLVKNCGVPFCSSSECRVEGEEYTGTISTTSTEITCLKWSLFGQSYDSNYCRNIKGTDDDAYCIVETDAGYYDKNCGIPICTSSENEGSGTNDEETDTNNEESGTIDESSESEDGGSDSGTGSSDSTECGVVSEEAGASSDSKVLQTNSDTCGQRHDVDNEKRSAKILNLLTKLFKIESRVANGVVSDSTTDSREWPWMVYMTLGETNSDGSQVYGSYSVQMCGASLITDQWILTAAHCVNAINSASSIGQSSCYFKLYLGEVNHQTTDETAWEEKTATAAKVILHSGYIEKTSAVGNDIALIKLPEKLTLDQRIYGTPCFADAGDTSEKFKDYTCYVAGWGTTEDQTTSNTIKHVEVDLLSDADCKAYVSQYADWDDSLICAGSHSDDKFYDSCQGDSGGALVCKYSDGKYYQVGVVSFGWTQTCGQFSSDTKHYGVYTDVTYYQEWISSIIDNN